MRRLSWLVMVVLGAVSCGGGSSSPESQLIGQWISTDSTGSQGVGLEFDSDGTYVAQLLELTSSTSANDEGESGVYTATSSTINFTPQKSSCPGPDPVYSLTYSFSAGGLVVATPSGAIGLTRNNPGLANGTITFGCFQPNGSFVASPVAPVGN